jgi:fibronectin type 3 domain-containing protein
MPQKMFAGHLNRHATRKSRQSITISKAVSSGRFGLEGLESRMLLTASTLPSSNVLLQSNATADQTSPTAVGVPAAPTSLNAVAGVDGVSLDWAPVPGADTYNVYRGDTSGGEAATPIQIAVNANAFLDASADQGANYFYQVTAVNAAGESVFSSEASTAAPSGQQSFSPGPVVNAPVNLIASIESDGVGLQWDAVNGAVSYNIYRGSSLGTESTTPYISNLSSSSFIDTGLNPGALYVYTVAAVDGSGAVSATTSEVAALTPIPAPDAPAGLSAVAVNNGISLKWTASVNDVSYLLFRGTTSGGEASHAIKRILTDNSYIDTTALPGQTYFYTIKAFNLSGASSASAEASATATVPAPAAPASLSASAGVGQIQLTWPAVTGATTYNIYRGASNGGESSTPYQTNFTGTVFIDAGVTGGTTYYYTVTAVNAGGESLQSPQASAMIALPRPAATAKLTATAPSSSTISLSWLDVPSETGFQVLQSTNGANYVSVGATAAGVTAYTASGLLPGTTYFYEVVTLGATGASNASSPASATTASGSAGLYGLTATPQPGEILLAWPAADGVTSYSVFRGTASGNESAQAIASGITTITNFGDSNVSAGVVYYYTVTAQLNNGQTLSSAEVSATPLAPTPNAPANFTAAAVPTGIQLNWNPVAGASSYNILRGLVSGNESLTPLQANISGTTFTDSAVSGVGTYYYLVAAVNASGQGAISQEVSARSPSVVGLPAPVGVSAVATSTSNITVSWSEVPGETGFEVLRSTDGVNFIQAATLSSGITNFADSGLNPATTYTYEVITLGASGASPVSATASAVTQTQWVGTNQPAPQPSNGWTTSSPGGLITPQTSQPNNIFYVGMPVTFQLGNSAVSYDVRDYYGNLVDHGTATPSTTVNVSQPGWYKLYVYGSNTSAQFGNILGTSTFVIFRNDPNFVQVTDLYNNGYYFIDNAMTRVDPTINFNWSNTSPTPSMGLDNYGVEWTGQIQAQFSETYTFKTVSDDGVRLWVNGTLLINNWTPHGAATDLASIQLTAGQRYDIKMEYFQANFAAQISLSWSSPSTPMQIIPAAALFPTAASTTAGGLTGNYFIGLSSSDPSENQVVRGIAGMGPERFNLDASNPTQAIASLQADIASAEATYAGRDPMRPADLLVSFTRGTSNTAGVEQIVAAFKNQVLYWEGQNEPDTGAYSGAGYVPVEAAFYNAVKSVDPNLQVLGPAVVSIADNGAGISWIKDFLANGGGKYLDGFSFHAYNTNQGQLYLLREALTSLTSTLQQYGLGNLPLWQTEQGFPAAIYGSYQTQLQGQWTMLQMMVYEQFGIPKEHNVLWYDDSHGYWDIPDWWQNDDGTLNPSAAVMRNWSEELFGATYTGAYNFGSANNLYIGDLFTGPGKSVAAFMSAGQANGSITLNVQGGTSLHVVSAFGDGQDLPVINGQVTLSLPGEPVYVEMAAGQTINVAPQNWGSNLALQPGAAATSSDQTDIQHIGKIISGVQENWYWDGDPVYGDLNYTDPNGWVQITLPNQETISRVIVMAMPPWQLAGTLMDFELQYFNEISQQWVTLDHVVQQPETFGVFSPVTRTTVDSYFDNQSIFQESFAPVTTSAIRVVVHAVTYGGGATQLVPESGGQANPTPTLTLAQIEIFGQ